MGISISHGVPSTRSALTIANLGQHLAHALSGSEWREVSHLFDGRVNPPLTVPPTEAGRIASILKSAAHRPSMATEWGLLALELAGAALRASHAGQNWEWS